MPDSSCPDTTPALSPCSAEENEDSVSPPSTHKGTIKTRQGCGPQRRRKEQEFCSQIESDVQASLRSLHNLSPLGQDIQPLPEDFVGRERDVWSVLQLLRHRKLVLVCGAPLQNAGIGKSTVLNA